MAEILLQADSGKDFPEDYIHCSKNIFLHFSSKNTNKNYHSSNKYYKTKAENIKHKTLKKQKPNMEKGANSSLDIIPSRKN
jgi:hypothetical protein